MKTILIKFLALFRRKEDVLARLIKDARLRESFLGVDRTRPETDGKKRMDANRILNYSRSEDYGVYAEEMWREVLSCVKKLTDPGKDTDEMNYYRGRLAATLDALQISYGAFQFLERPPENMPPVLNGIGRDSTAPGR